MLRMRQGFGGFLVCAFVLLCQFPAPETIGVNQNTNTQINLVTSPPQKQKRVQNLKFLNPYKICRKNTEKNNNQN